MFSQVIDDAKSVLTQQPEAATAADPTQAGTIVEQAGAVAEPVSGPVASTMHDVVPETGVKLLDSSMNTFADSVGGLLDSVIARIPQILLAILVLIITAFIAGLMVRIVRRFTKKVRVKQNLQDLFGKLTYIGVWFLGLVAAAGIIFPGLGMGQLVATAGLASIAVGFAFQDIFENFLAGVLIIWKHPFNDGDFIEIPSQNILGLVEETQIRMTCIRAVTGELIIVPNAMIYKSVVHVLTNRKTRRMSVTCGIAYAEDVAEGRGVIQKALESCETVHKDQPMQVFAKEFADSSINFDVTWWTGPAPLDQRKSRDEVIEKVKAALNAANIEIPYPYRTLTFTRNEPDIINAIAGHLPAGGGEDES